MPINKKIGFEDRCRLVGETQALIIFGVQTDRESATFHWVFDR